MVKALKPIKPSEVIKRLKERQEARQTEAHSFVKALENKYIPEEIAKYCPTGTKIYNLYEHFKPCTGHLAWLVAICLASMWTDEPRQVNATIASRFGEGKTVILSQFAVYPWCHFIARTSFADYLINFCGYYLDTSAPLGRGDIPPCVEVQRIGKKVIVSTAKCKDLINKYYTIVHAGEGISTIPGRDKLLQLWNQLIEEGYWEGGDRDKGRYKIGSALFRVKHGLILGCTFDDLKGKWMKEYGTLSRTLVVFYWCTDKENRYIELGRMPPNPKLPSIENFSQPLGVILEPLARLGPSYEGVKMTFSSEVNESICEELVTLIASSRLEPTRKRAVNDMLRLLKACARLEMRNKVTIYDYIVVNSLLQMCRKTRVGDKEYYFGDRLHFQARMRYLLNGDVENVVREMNHTFKWWDSDKPLYDELEVRDAVGRTAQPIHVKMR